MRFELVDRVLELTTERIVTIKHVSSAEEYLQDHFPTFPVLPGVLMLEMLVQSARRLAEARPEWNAAGPPLVLGRVRALKYGRLVKPGDTLRAEVLLTAAPVGKGEPWEFRASAVVNEPGAVQEPPVAVSGRLTLRPVKASAAVVSAGLPG
jgi:3-hydroxyacyl-[acyl-carrier-protein] dehydratase